MSGRVGWQELLPHEFDARISARPIVYLPMGLCEPHGMAAAFGLDTLKAEFICQQAAHRFGGIVAPTQAYHIHECGYHAPFLEEAVGSDNPRLGSLPPELVLRTLLYQFRAFANAGFRTLVVVSGHNGAQADLRLVANEFMRLVPVRVLVRSDPELIRDVISDDHAGRFELSQLLHARPDLVDLARVTSVTGRYGRLAQGADAHAATAEFGEEILGLMIERLGNLIDITGIDEHSHVPFLDFADVEPTWAAIEQERDRWVSYGPVSG